MSKNAAILVYTRLRDGVEIASNDVTPTEWQSLADETGSWSFVDAITLDRLQPDDVDMVIFKDQRHGRAGYLKWRGGFPGFLLPGRSSRRELQLPPGFRIRRWAELLADKETYLKVFHPTIADMQSDWLEAHKRGDLEKARWIKIRGYYEIFKAVLKECGFSLLKLAINIGKRILG